MQLFSLAAAMTGLAGLTAAVPSTRRCPVTASDSFKAVAAAMSAMEASNSTNRKFTEAATITVDTYFHVVAASTSLSDGYIPDSQLSAQLDVLNVAYEPYGIQFNLLGTTRTINTNWANDRSELAMKQSLREGDYGTLNIYFLKSVSGYLGYAYLPDDVSQGSNDFYYDGATILYSSVPGGSATNYNLGHTVTHEVGHWLGLLHTFEGYSCSGSGDQVSDTPQQLSETSGCPEGRDSCPNQPGLDPIHNYMDYSYDACFTGFSAGQETRMVNMWSAYRA